MKTFYWNPLLTRTPDYLEMHLHYMKNTGHILTHNFGDSIGKLLLGKIVPEKTFYWSGPKSAVLFSTGSILETILRTRGSKIANIWGSGFREYGFDKSTITRNSNIIALRGELSAAQLSIPPIKVALGDPALLFSKYFDVKLDNKNKFNTFIPHFSYYQQQIDRGFKPNTYIDDLKVVNVGQNVLEVVNAISNSHVLFSSAMHPLIVADSLGIPAVRIVSNLSELNSFKYKDYLSVFPGKKSWPVLEFSKFRNGDFSEEKVRFESQLRLDKNQATMEYIQENLTRSLRSWFEVWQ